MIFPKFSCNRKKKVMLLSRMLSLKLMLAVKNATMSIAGENFKSPETLREKNVYRGPPGETKKTSQTKKEVA
ncbi:MAG: hypothetical protein LBF33_00295 [Oscillospiraceae bacterium]|nr:hypothetical protein [Oscillospiraceae bacterium]